jgi:hypothetical protein
MHESPGGAARFEKYVVGSPPGRAYVHRVRLRAGSFRGRITRKILVDARFCDAVAETTCQAAKTLFDL